MAMDIDTILNNKNKTNKLAGTITSFLSLDVEI